MEEIKRYEPREVGFNTKTLAQYNEEVSKAMPKSYEKQKQGISYYDIGKIETQLDRVFSGLWNTDVISTQIIANSIVVTLKLSYFNPAAKIWQWKTGIGAAPINTKKGASPVDMESIIHDSIQKSAPSAKAYALKNAAAQIGNAFGRHLNREFSTTYKSDEKFEQMLNDL